MKRDGYTKSIWQDNSKEIFAANNDKTKIDYDVLIVGAGITGMTLALLLQQAGMKCAIAEAYNIGFGTTGGTTAHLNNFFDTPFYKIANRFGEDNATLVAQGAKEAQQLIKNNVAQYKIECTHKEVQGYLIALNNEQEKELNKIVDAAQDVGIDMKFTTSAPIPIPFIKAAQTGLQAQFHPLQYINGLAKVFQNAGGVILEHCRVNDVYLKENEQLEVDTTLGKLFTKRLVYATHIPPGVNQLHFMCAPYRSYVLAFTIKNNDYPDATIYDLDDPYRYYRSQVIDNVNYLIAGGEDHKTGHETNTELPFKRLEAYVRKYFDVAEIKYKWSSQFYESADGLPYVGLLPTEGNNIFTATGYGGNGMIFGTLSAIVLKDIIVHGYNKFQQLFSPNRVKPIASFKNVIREGADVVSTLISSMFSPEEIEQFISLAPNEAKLATYHDTQLAIYKDEKHKLHIVSPKCTHIGCSVSWNTVERSWDCPCHGARYNVDGAVLNAPSTQNLRKPLQE